ncbi:MAG: transglutaminase-like domain-containing protein [Poseidonia sp.]
MAEDGEFWRLAQDYMESESKAGDNEPDVPEPTEVSTNVGAITQRSFSPPPGILVALVMVGVLVVASTISVVLWSLSDYDPNDVDGDGIANEVDDCYDGLADWTSSTTLDHDGDGCHDAQEDDDDDNDTVFDDGDACPTGSIGWLPTAETDRDGDGCHDDLEDTDDDNDNVSDDLDAFPLDASEWQDSDGDGVGDNGDAFPEDPSEQFDTDGDGWGDNSDAFPFNGSEWLDEDGDGWGDNADPDDDNDGSLDENDLHLGQDVGIVIQFERFTLFDPVDWFSDTGDMYFCYSIYNQSDVCLNGNGAFTVTVGESAFIGVNASINLDEGLRHHWIELSVYDRDPLVDDNVDIHPDEGVLRYTVVYDSFDQEQNLSFVANGSGDGDAGSLTFSLAPLDYLGLTRIDYSWTFDGTYQSLQIDTTHADYLMYRNMNHAIDWRYASTYEDIIPQYAAFSTPNDATIEAVAEQLRSNALAQGYTSDLDILRFIYAFVGQIQYAYDIDTTNFSEYPKYPLEMLYDRSGDCEDSSALFISLVESLGYDAGLMLGDVKADEDDDWGGHAWPVVALDNHSGWSINGVGEKSNLTYYFVESTAYEDDWSDIGVNPWYEITDEAFFDVER